MQMIWVDWAYTLARQCLCCLPMPDVPKSHVLAQMSSALLKEYVHWYGKCSKILNIFIAPDKEILSM